MYRHSFRTDRDVLNTLEGADIKDELLLFWLNLELGVKNRVVVQCNDLALLDDRPDLLHLCLLLLEQDGFRSVFLDVQGLKSRHQGLDCCRLA